MAGIGISTGDVSSGTALGVEGGPPPNGYEFIQGKNADGSYTVLTVLNADGSRDSMAGKV